MAEIPITFRAATRDDLDTIIGMLADDPLGAARETAAVPILPAYDDAFEAIAADPNNELIVAEFGGEIIAVLQLTFIPYLTYRGSWRALIEGVRVASAYRSQGIGHQLFAYAIARARARNCILLQLTSDKARPDAIRFYEKLGFVASHEGLKLHLG